MLILELNYNILFFLSILNFLSLKIYIPRYSGVVIDDNKEIFEAGPKSSIGTLQ
jgi:hypothetical protein